MNTHQHPGIALRELMKSHCVGLPGAFNGLCARAVKDAGFHGAYVSGAAVTASFGVPDIGLLTVNEFTNVIRQVTQSSGLPVIADADTGFGEGEMVTRTVIIRRRRRGLPYRGPGLPQTLRPPHGKTSSP
ncbi:MAG: isocitrate lyase/phosphoenolpyruvate mutase family protein [Phycisphaerales bacterium]